MNFISSEVMLLTGAGFSHNFGCPLSKDMRSWIFNQKEVQNSPHIRELLFDNLDFESVVYEVTQGAYTPDEKRTLNAAVQSAFDQIDRIILNWTGNRGSQNELNSYGWEDLLTRFAGSRNGTNGTKGFIFTLNQDLMLERHYVNHPNSGPPVLLGLNPNPNWFKGISPPFQNGDFTSIVPDKGSLMSNINKQLEQNNFFYIKLHGSQNWRRNGQTTMVIGGGKEEIIKNEPILCAYHEIFKQAVFQESRKLLIIGYGFRDEHISEIIFEAIRDFNLKIYILSPQRMEEWQEQVKRNHPQLTKVFFEGLAGYFPYDLKNIFPPDQSNTIEWQQMIKDLFNN